MYLDMNGIIHSCSHPNDDDVHFRISEEQIFNDIFRYVDFLFNMIKPRKVFFMAIDGVAPRAKMNQQRGRRFRSAKDAEKREAEAIAKGQKLPDEARFDSNCITPGTKFMDRLHKALKWYVTDRMSKLDQWKNVRVILSGHETPGEGEHKIMDFIRYERSQPGYDPNTRHCLYGLDADLIILGLCSHELHFTLLREEVLFMKSKSPKITKSFDPSNITFHLLHLSLFRDYLGHEFASVKNSITFDFNLEGIIDDWILMTFLVGNDFIPNLPHFHINRNSLTLLYEAYKEALPEMGGYMNEDGTLNLKRFEIFLKKVSQIDQNHFKEIHEGPIDGLARNNHRQGRNPHYRNGTHQNNYPNLYKGHNYNRNMNMNMNMNMMHMNSHMNTNVKQQQRAPYSVMPRGQPQMSHNGPPQAKNGHSPLPLPTVGNKDRVLQPFYDDEENDRIQNEIAADKRLSGLFGRGNKVQRPPLPGIPNSSIVHHQQIRRQFHSAPNTKNHVQTNGSRSHDETEDSDSYPLEEEFRAHKSWYYQQKLEYANVDQSVLAEQATCYIRALQWNLHYYYNGCVSWSWYYPHHYAPYISDVKNFSNVDLTFEKGTPFMPFDQLLAVLPAASLDLLPGSYKPLVTDPQSALIDNYPKDFELDLNEKKQDWEAVVKIPFIDEKELLSAVAIPRLFFTPEEKERNKHGPHLEFKYSPDALPPFETPFTCFNTIMKNHAEITPIHQDHFHIPRDQIKHGLLPNANPEALSPGFPTLRFIRHAARLKAARIRVFEMPSRGESFILDILDHVRQVPLDEVMREVLNKRVYVNWPHLIEMRVFEVTDFNFIGFMKNGRPSTRKLEPREEKELRETANEIKSTYYTRRGINIGHTFILLKCIPSQGQRIPQYAPYQTVVKDRSIQRPEVRHEKRPEKRTETVKTVRKFEGNPELERLFGNRTLIMAKNNENKHANTKGNATKNNNLNGSSSRNNNNNNTNGNGNTLESPGLTPNSKKNRCAINL